MFTKVYYTATEIIQSQLIYNICYSAVELTR